MDTKGLVTANLYTVWIQCGLIGIVTLLVWPLIKQQVKKLPPGPIGLPFVGYWPFITSDPHEKFGELTKKYGPVFGVNILGKYYLVLNEFDAIKEAFVKQNDNFSGRPQEFSFFSWFFNFDSFVFHYGDEWKTQRRFAIKSLRDLGTGKWLEAKIQEYVADMMECVTETKGQPTDLYDYFLIPVLNVISGLVANKKYNVKDPEYWQLRDDIRGVFRTFPDAELQLCGPMMRGIANRFYPRYKEACVVKDRFFDLMNKYINEHRSEHDTNDPANDYIDAFLNEEEVLKQKGLIKESSFEHERLVSNAIMLYAAGTETTSHTVYWAVNLLASYPEIQRKCHEEMDEVVGRERQPSMADRVNLPYTDAFIHEVQRYSAIVPFPPLHINILETKIGGYTVPKNTRVFANLWSALKDPKYFKNPDEFDPNNFLDENKKFSKPEAWIPFGVGKRLCAGEILARMELFLILTNLLQKFTFVPPEGVVYKRETHSGFTRTLHDFKICAILRE